MKFLLVSSYPNENSIHGMETVGGASYSKNMILALKDLDETNRIVVLADILDVDRVYEEDGVFVRRIWERGNIEHLGRLFKEILHEDADINIISFEMNMFGGPIQTGVFIFFLLLLKIMGKNIHLILHQVVSDFSPLEKNKVKLSVLNWLKDVFYVFLLFISTKTIVFEDKFKESLGNSQKITVIPHGVEAWKKVPKHVARKRLRLNEHAFYVLYFGYTSPYKGLEELIKMWKGTKNRKLIIAGGGNPNHMENKNYVKFLNKINRQAKKKNIITTGFVPEKKIPLYFSAADLVVLPYKMFMSSSGPLSFAFSFEKPILISKALEGYFESADFRNALRNSPLTKKNIVFTYNGQDFSEKISWASQNIRKLVEFSKEMKERRAWEKIRKEYREILVS